MNWRRVQVDRLRNVEVVLRTRLSAPDVREYGAEIVVVATGSRWAGDGLNGVTHEPLPGADPSLPYILTPEQVMVGGKRPLGERVLVWDCEGYFTGAGLAELLAGEGYRVELVSALEEVAPLCNETLEGLFLRKRLHDVGVSMRRGVLLRSVGPGGARGEDEFGEPLELAADAVVLVTQRLSDDALYHELAGGEREFALYRIGDCVAPRLVADVIFDGHRLAREIDTENPAVPLPYKRERALARELDFPPR